MSTDERFVDELRTTLRFIFAMIYRRLKKASFPETLDETLFHNHEDVSNVLLVLFQIDMPTLVLDKLIKNALQHLDSYLKVRRKLRASMFGRNDFTMI